MIKIGLRLALPSGYHHPMPNTSGAADDLVYLPSSVATSRSGEDQPHSRQITLVDSYIRKCAEFISSTFRQSCRDSRECGVARADDVISVLLHGDFNYQSRGRVVHLLPRLKSRIEGAMRNGGEVPIYFLYHGGYRCSPERGSLFSFTPDLTELLLLYQVARLHHRLKAIGVDGLRFFIVINNGVASYTNGIPYDATGAYVERLRALIHRLDATQQVSVLAQSELGRFEDKMAAARITAKAEITMGEHAIVERFLGRCCSAQEACQFAARYEKAEAVWGAELKSIVEKHSGLFCRQIAHPECLSFRPFPGGAIRVQNGTVGFRVNGDRVVPVLVTPKSQARMISIPLSHGCMVPPARHPAAHES